MATANLNARERAALEEKKKDQQIRNRFLVVGIIVVVLAALVIVVNSRIFTNHIATLKVSDGVTTTNYALADVNYAYQNSYMQMYQNYSSYGLINNTTPLDEQECIFLSDGGTWDDYFKEQAEAALKEKTAVWTAAEAAGYTTLTEEEQAQIDETIDTIATYAPYYNTTLDGYLALNYGSGNNEKTVRANMAQELLMARYLQDMRDGFTYTDAELDAYYTEHQDELDKVKYLYVLIPGTSDEENAMEQAKATAESIVEAAQGDEELYRAAVTEAAGGDPTATSYSISSFMDMYGDNITRDDLKAGACFTHETESGWYAIYVQELDDNNYNTVSVRHILVAALDEDGDGEYSDAEKQTAYDSIKAIEEEWLAGEATEESFAALANEKSTDSGSNTNGGLYENIYKGEMVPEFDAFCFDEHQSGDTAIVYGESNSYCGYHLVYFVGEGDNYRHVQAETTMRSNDYSEFYQSLLTPYTSAKTFMWRYVMK